MKPKTVRISTNAQDAAAVRPNIRSASSRFNSIEERKENSNIKASGRRILNYDESYSTNMRSRVEDDYSE